MNRLSDWTHETIYQGAHRLVVVRDLDQGRRSVTNDIEAVVRELQASGALRVSDTLIYSDSEGQVDQVIFDQNGFVGFYCLGGVTDVVVAANLLGFLE